MYEQSRSTLRVVCIGADVQSRTLLPERSRARTLGARSREVYRVCFFDFKLNGRGLSTQCKLVLVGSGFKYLPPLQQSLLNIVNIYLKIYHSPDILPSFSFVSIMAVPNVPPSQNYPTSRYILLPWPWPCL